ncbi:MAG: hypothetical protein ACTSPQ_19655 [Candidatus Helarchaeota archaeon]
MRRLESKELELLYAGADLAACFGAGLFAAIAIGNWWNPGGIIAFEGAMLSGLACIAEN